jgi:DNA polymerase III sliding clamp (beta) subunit (PCNA family)
MHIRIDEKTFAHHFGKVKAAIGKQGKDEASGSIHPILRTVVLEADQRGWASIKASDLATESLSLFEAEVLEPGAIAIVRDDIPKLYGLKEIYSNEERQVWFISESGKTRLNGINPEDYPTFVYNKKDEIDIAASTLLQGINAVSFAASQELHKGTWASVYIALKGNSIDFIAGESNRGALVCLPYEEQLAETSCMISTPSIKAIAALLQEEAGNVSLEIDESRILVKGETGYVSARLLTGAYPGTGFQVLINRMNNDYGAMRRTIRFSVPDMLRALEVVEPAASANKQRLYLEVDPAEDLVKISAKSASTESYQEVPACIQGEPLKVWVNFSYLLPNLKNLGDKEGIMEFFGDRVPFLLKPATSKQDKTIITAVMTVS